MVRGQRGGARGGARGRGHGRGRGRGGHRGQRRQDRQQAEDQEPAQTAVPENLDVDQDVKPFFVGNASFEQHLEAQEKNKTRYIAGFLALQESGVDVAQNALVRSLAGAWARHDHELAEALMQNRKNFGLVEVLKALSLLDSARQIRFFEKKARRLQASGARVKPTTMGKLKSNIDNLTAVRPPSGSASGALARHIKRWARTLTKDELEFYALHMPTENWRKLADIVHFHPEKDFPALPWFLPFCFGQNAPEETMVARCKNMTAENVNSLITEFDIPYSHLKPLKDHLTPDSKARIGQYTPKLDTILWWYEDLMCAEVDKVIDSRLKEGHEVSLTYGKLMERLLVLKMIRNGVSLTRHSQWMSSSQEPEETPESDKAPFYSQLLPIAEARLSSIKLALESPVVVIGDASGSMEVAIRTATIISSLLTAICSAKLVFFNGANLDAPFVPKTIEDVIDLAIKTKASGSTAPAASLMPFYINKEVIKTFIIVTDEEENTSAACLQDSESYRFMPLYQKYLAEVSPTTRLVFVSFLKNQHQVGQMYGEMVTAQVPNLMQFKFDQTRPDLTKLDKLFGLLSSQSQESFDELLQTKETALRADGIVAALKQLELESKEKH